MVGKVSECIVPCHVETGGVYWSTANTNAANEVTKSCDLGAVAIRNSSTEQQEFLLLAAHRIAYDDTAEQEWHMSEHKIFFEQPGYILVGFEDHGHVNDFDDIRVSVLQADSADMRNAPLGLATSRTP